MTLKQLQLFFGASFVLLPVASSIAMPFSHPTDTSKESRSTTWAPAPTPAPVLRNQLLRRDPRTCGALQGGYTDAPPVCSGSASLCIFTSSSGYQGCCHDEHLDSCTFYTTCYPFSNQASCKGPCTSSGLVCPSSAPECTQYTYQFQPDSTASTWTGFACGSQQATSPPIWAWAVNGIDPFPSSGAASSETSPSTSPTTSSSSRSAPSVAISSLAPSTTKSFSSLSLLPPPTAPSSTRSTTAPASASTSSAGEIAVAQSHKDVGAIAGGVVGGVIGLALLAGAIIWWLTYRKRRERAGMAPMRQRELGRPWP